ncbi:hypothetical protein ACFFP0_20725 [Rhizobium puerariae]|uniref:DUF680 domain-containing protein n=1 Tax=Rhizobium puerariae TaxID=1585791 RepID=A0ABV6AMF6_9HYPH
MTKIIAPLIAALIAAASFAGAALAGNGDYYEGIWPNQASESVHKAQSDSYGYTGSISRAHDVSGWHLAQTAPERGDYYEGVNRPT